MINLSSYKGKYFERGNYEDFLRMCNSLDKFTKKRLQDSAGGLELNSYTIGDNPDNPYVLIDGCMHNGHEWRSSYWILHFMEVLNDPKEHYIEAVKDVEHLLRNYNITFVPVASPDNFVNAKQTGTANNVNVTENFDFLWRQTNWGQRPDRNKGEYPFSETESQNIRDIILDKKPVGYVNGHGFGGYMGLGIRMPQEKKNEVVIKEFLKNSLFNCYPIPDDDTILYNALGMASSYNWAGTQTSSRGEKIIATVFEVGTYAEPEDQSRMGVVSLLVYLLTLDNYLITGNQVIHK